MTVAMALIRYDEHRRQPRSLGRMADPDATGNVGSVAVGRALRFFIKLDTAKERITATRFQTFSCGDQVAAASVLAELVVGKRPDEALVLGPAEVCAHLGGLPWTELPPQLWGLEALRDAIGRLHGLTEPPVDEERLRLVCRCHGIDEDTLRRAWDGGATDLAALTTATRAGSGCGTCRRDVEALLSEWTKAPPAATTPAKGATQGRIALLHKIDEASASLLADARKHGVTCTLWDLRGVSVLIRPGAGTTPEALQGLLEQLQRTLQDEVDPTLRVEIGGKDSHDH